MVAADIPAGILASIGITLIPIGAGFLAWVVKELRAVTEINATTTQRLAGLERRVGRIEDVVWKPAWGPYRPKTEPPPTGPEDPA